MIYASDLDQTLIYSRRSMGGEVAENDLLLIETLEGKEISFLSRRALQLLLDIHERCLFIPVTTRTMEQYQRITVFQQELQPHYAITSNGGNIFCNGEIDRDWRAHVQRELEEKCLPLSQILEAFEKIQDPSWFYYGKVADDIFYYAIIERDRLPIDKIQLFEEWLQKQHWQLSIQGRKLYLVPQVVNKGSAVKYISSKEGNKPIIASGDSLLDFDLLRMADLGYIPGHGEIYRSLRDSLDYRIETIHQSGMIASELILKRVLERLRKFSM